MANPTLTHLLPDHRRPWPAVSGAMRFAYCTLRTWQIVCGQTDEAARRLPELPWLIREPVKVSPRVEVWNLGHGESGVLSHALAHPPLRAVIDDRDARRTAQALGIPILGTGGVLLLAKRRGLLPSVTIALDKLRGAGLWLSDDLIRMIRDQAGE